MIQFLKAWISLKNLVHYEMKGEGHMVPTFRGKLHHKPNLCETPRTPIWREAQASWPQRDSNILKQLQPQINPKPGGSESINDQRLITGCSQGAFWGWMQLRGRKSHPGAAGQELPASEQRENGASSTRTQRSISGPFCLPSCW